MHLSRLVLAAVLSCSLSALAVPRVVGSVSQLGTWSPPSGPELKDDGVSPDLVAGDGVFTATVTFPAGSGLVEYKVVPTGVDFTGAIGTTTGQNMKFPVPSSTPLTVTFFYDTRSTASVGWAPATESIGDTANATRTAAGNPITWVAVGDFQLEVGDSSNFNQASTVTVALDDGKRGDRLAGDGIFTYRFRATAPLSNKQFKFAAQGASWTTKLGANGWSYDPDDSANATFSANTGELVTLELDARRGRLRAHVSPPPAKLVISELVVSPTEGEFVEIYNPGTTTVDLGDYYLADNEKYYELPSATPTALNAGDFVARFPDGASIGPGQYQTVAVYGGTCFKLGVSAPNCAAATGNTFPGYGVDATYELPSTHPARLSATVPELTPAFPGSVTSSKGFTNAGEVVVLFAWDGLSDLVTDVDYLVYGVPSSFDPLVDKNGVSIDGPDADTTPSTYAAEAPAAPANAIGVASNSTQCRFDFAEGAQGATGSNGIGGRNETSEVWSATWKECAWAITPNAPTATFVEVTPASPVVEIGAQLTLTATAYGDLGKAQPFNAPVTWSTVPGTPTRFSLDPATATLTGVAAGANESVVATVGGLSQAQAVTVRYHAVTVTCDQTAIPTGGTASCSAQAFDASNQPLSNISFQWDVQSGTSGTVSSSGVVTADPANAGPLVVRARGAGDATTQGTFTIDVQTPVVTQLAVAFASSCPSADCIPVAPGSEYRIAGGATVSFTASGTDQFGSPIAVTNATWVSSDLNVAPAPTNGMVTVANVLGFSAISAEVGAVSSNAIVLSVEPRAPDQLAIMGVPTGATFDEGTTLQLGVSVTDQFGAAMSNPMETWSSSAASVATVDSTGLVTGVAPGSVTITATAGAATDSETLTVAAVPKVTTINVMPSTHSLQVGQQVTFTAAALDQFGAPMSGIVFAWSSSGTAVATVDASTGEATGVGAGMATITASAAGKTGTATLTVTPEPQVVTTVTVAPPTAMITVGQQQPFTATVRDQHGVVMTGVAVTWSSEDEDVATVDGLGVATATSVGSTSITATADGKSGTGTLTVTAQPPQLASIEVTPDMVSVAEGGTATFTATAIDTKGQAMSGVTFTWTSSDPGVATVEDGVATGVAPGAATITASAEGKSGSGTLNVLSSQPVVAKIELTPPSASLEVGTGQQFTARAVDSAGVEISGITIEWSSTDTEVAPVATDGFVTGRSPGQATIAASGGGKSAEATVTVGAKTATGCGCATSAVDVSGLWAFALALLPMVRRRRSKA